MDKQDLIKLKEKLSKLNETEEKQRDIYLKQLSDGTLSGPQTGFASIDKPWLKYFDDSFITQTADKLTIYENLKKCNESNLDATAIFYFSKKYTYANLIDKIDSVAKSFMEMGVSKGDIVTLSLPNIPENVFCLYALNKIGAIANFIDLRMKDDKLINAINSTKSKIIIATDLFIKNLDDVIDKTTIENIVVASPYDSLPLPLEKLKKMQRGKIKMHNAKFVEWKQFEQNGEKSTKHVLDVPSYEDSVCILHTSGTTGAPKGVVLTNKNFIEMALQVKNGGLKYSKGDIFLSQVPPFLAYNVLAATNNPLTMGLQITMLPDYQPSKFAENILTYRPNHVIAGPADWSNFLENKKIKNKKFDFLVSMISGSDKIDETQKSAINDFLQKAGCKGKILEGYGMTEIGAAAVMNVPKKNEPYSVGIPLRSVNVSIYDNDRNMELPYGEEGEICLSGPTVMKEYFDNKEETNNMKRLHEDGKYWLHTGDVGYLTKDGNLYLKGRMKRIIVRFDGIKVSPYDIEKVVLASGIADNCCVVGVKDFDKGYGSVPVVNVVLKSDENLDKSSDYIFELCKQHLAENYQPKMVMIWPSLPLTEVGKIDYRKIQKEVETLIEKNDVSKIKVLKIK